MKIEDFTKGVNDWNNHLFLLWLALAETDGDVVELGCGDGSTVQLHDYCKLNQRNLFSFDTDLEWLNKYKECESLTHSFTLVNNWDLVKNMCPNPSVVLVDHAPGERRIEDVKIYANAAEVLVLHDTQPQPTAAGYEYEKIWDLFKYRVDLTVPMNREVDPPDNRTWASMVSNKIDITKYKGLSFGEYTIK